MTARPSLPAATIPEPVKTLEVELTCAIPAIAANGSMTGRSYRRSRLLVRLQTRPIGLVNLEVPEEGLSEADVAFVLWEKLGQTINHHLSAEGIGPVDHLSLEGLEIPLSTGYLRAREVLLDSAPLLSVIVSTRDGAEVLARCLPHLLGLRYPRFEVIVVDNAPRTAATRELIERDYATDPRVRYVLEARPGLSQGRNAGLEHARGEIAVITDDDVAPDPDWLIEIVRGFKLGQKVACVTGPILAEELETPAQLWIEQFGGFSKGFEERLFDLQEHRPNSVLFPYAAGMFGSGANIAFRTSILRELGGFDVALGAGSVARGGEELAAFVQLIRRGYQIAYQPGAFIYHAHHRDYEALQRQIYSYGIGLTAYLTKIILDDPRCLLEMIPKIPRAIYHALSPKSGKNRAKDADYPPELTRLEVMGMLQGPFAYLNSRRERRRAAQSDHRGQAAFRRGRR